MQWATPACCIRTGTFALCRWVQREGQMCIRDSPYGICYSEVNFTAPGTKTVSLAPGDTKNYIPLTRANVQNRSYPLYDSVYLYANGSAEHPMDPKVKEFLRFVLSQEGQQAIVKDGKYLPLTKEVVDEQLKKLQ